MISEDDTENKSEKIFAPFPERLFFVSLFPPRACRLFLSTPVP
jgi:hypothetical protein